MAWLLADAADAVLVGRERTMTFVELGSGEHGLAIDRIISAIVSNRMTLPSAIFDRLLAWLDSYAGSPDERHLRSMVSQMRPQRCHVPS